jgi:hypothetical protein
MHAEVITPNGTEGAFDAGPLACIPLGLVKLNACGDAEGSFGASPPACIPNTKD